MPPLRTRKKKTPEPSCSANVQDVDEDDYNLKNCRDELDDLKPMRNISTSISNKLKVVPKVFHNNFLYSVGDIISLRNDDSVYYAQIRVIVENIFSEKYVAVIWLLPTQCEAASPNRDFDPFTFMYGPQDEWFYNLNDVSFVMHPPTKFFKRFIPPVPKNSDFIHVMKYKFKPTAKRKS